MKVFITDLGLLFVFQLQVKARMEYGDSSVYFPFTFTQQDIDNVLYGYIRTPEKSTNGFALSGIYVALANGRFDHQVFSVVSQISAHALIGPLGLILVQQ